MPPCAICEDAALAPEQKSPRSTSSTSTPFSARSRKAPMPLMPPPTITTGISGLPFREASISFRFMSLHPVEGPRHGLLPAFVQSGARGPFHGRVPALVLFPVEKHVLGSVPEADCQPSRIG